MNYKKLTGAGIAALGFILFSILVWPLFTISAELKTAIESKRTVLDEKKEALGRILDLKSKVGAKRNEIAQLTAVLPADKKIQEILVNIEEAARQSGIDLRDFKTGAVASLEKDAVQKILQVGLSGSGSYSSILDFFKLLEKNLRIFDVQDFTVSQDASGTAAGRLNLDLKLFTYYLDS